jgi:hypothetical protein
MSDLPLSKELIVFFKTLIKRELQQGRPLPTAMTLKGIAETLNAAFKNDYLFQLYAVICASIAISEFHIENDDAHPRLVK